MWRRRPGCGGAASHDHRSAVAPGAGIPGECRSDSDFHPGVNRDCGHSRCDGDPGTVTDGGTDRRLEGDIDTVGNARTGGNGHRDSAAHVDAGSYGDAGSHGDADAFTDSHADSRANGGAADVSRQPRVRRRRADTGSLLV
ncbi:MAG: hypothetical protein QF664_11575 [Dehalococcoidia bacterium]|nr:hypothetical protein [Dehalococcoidia bacterium]